jgi:RND family efflux transporter MFP subunit
VSVTWESLRTRRNWNRRHLAVAGAALLLCAAFLGGYLPRHLARSRLVAATAATQAPPRVAVTKAVAVNAGRQLTLPAGLLPRNQTLVYARASGYVRRWLVDIGAHVKTGQLLVVLETPDLDQQLAQAQASLSQTIAALAQAKANRRFAYITARREAELFGKALISAQENDQAQTQALAWNANVKAAQATVQAQSATVRQLEQLVAFGRVYAPYDGIVTRRLVDVGTLVNAGAGSSTVAMFELATTDPMLAYVDVPQAFAPSVHVGAEAKIAVRSFPGRVFAGRVARTAGALDPASRTLRTEVDTPNASGELLSGMYVDVSLDVAVSHTVIRVPSSAVIADSRGVHVAVVDGSGKVHLVAVTPGLDDGTTVELVQGLSGGEQVISTPASDVADGQQVQAQETKAPEAKAPEAKTPDASNASIKGESK